MIEEARHRRQVHVISPEASVRGWAGDLWLYRNVLLALCSRDIKGKYKQASLGLAWAILQPAVQVVLFTLVFRGVARVETPVFYPLFVLAALLPFNLFQQVVSMGTPSFVTAQGIVTKVYFPRIYTIIAGSSTALVNGAITLALLVAVLLAYGRTPSARMVVALPMLLGIFLLAVGVATLLGALNAKHRDVQHGLPLLMTILIYVSPVLYPLEAMPRAVRPLVMLNPVAGLVDGFRAAVLGVEPYSWPLAWAGFAAALVIFAAGVWVFERTQAKLIDVL
jgi:lipopolysaccharide transport system permease protein